MVDLYDYKFRYNFKKYETVTYNKIIFKSKPYPFNISKVRVVLKAEGDFIGINEANHWWNWWEIVPNHRFKKCIYWIKFYPWYYIRFKKLNSN